MEFYCVFFRFYLNYLVNSNFYVTNFTAQFIHISHIHHIIEYLAELFFIHFDVSLMPILTNEFFLNHLVNFVLIVKKND